MMKRYAFLLLLCFNAGFAQAQKDSISNILFLAGASTPELAHVGLGAKLGNRNMIAVAFGIAPTWGGIWPAWSVEHRIYFKSLRDASVRRNWLLKQGYTYFTTDGESAIAFTVGTESRNKRRPHRGWTIDAGVFLLFQTDGWENRWGPALRFQYYSLFKRNQPIKNQN